MFKGFDRIAPVVVVAQRRRIAAPAGRRRHVLYPALAYRVIAPTSAPKELNILQRAVLGLCRAGVVRAGDVGTLLKVHEDLAAKVLQSLQSSRLLDGDGRPTAKGLSAFESNVASGEERPVAGYVFQDPWTRSLWPRFVERMVYADVAPRDDGFADLLSGTAGEPRAERAFTIWPREQFPIATPSATEVLQVVRRHGRLHLNVEDADNEEKGEASGVTKLEDAPRLERLTHIESEPRALYLKISVYAPEVPIDGKWWEATDPFGGGRSTVARESLLRRMQVDTGLDGLINSLVMTTQAESASGLGEVLERLEVAAALQVENRLGQAIRGTPLYALAVAMERAKQEAVIAAERCPLDKLDDVLLKAQSVIEQVFAEVRLRHPREKLWMLLDGENRKNCAAQITTFSANVGFNVPLPAGLTNVKVGKVRYAVDNGGGSLRPRLIAAILTAAHKLLHPLRAAAVARPELLRELNLLAEMRDESGHARENRMIPVDLDIVVQQTEIAYITGQLLAHDPVTVAVTPAKPRARGVAQ